MREPSILIIRLSSCRDTAASSTHAVLEELIRSVFPKAEVDIAFLPPKSRSQVVGRLSGRDWSLFDLVLVSNAFVQEALNLPWLLHANQVPVWADARAESFPPVLLGGANACVTQCLVTDAQRAVPDAIFFGEAEEALPRFLQRWQMHAGLCKQARLCMASEGCEGFWVAGEKGPIQHAVARTDFAQTTLRVEEPSSVWQVDTEHAGTGRLTVSRGCPAFCSFCFEGYERKPYREMPLDVAVQRAKALKQVYGLRTLELDAFNLNTYASLQPLVEQCVRLFDRVAFKSQRADGVAAQPAIIALERAAGKQSFTLGIEGISGRMRAFLNKSLSDADLMSAVQTVLQQRVREMKLFYILTGHETAEDLAEFNAFCERVQASVTALRSTTRIIFSIGRLVRMPNTPLIFDRLFLREEEWRFCVDGVAAACRRNRLECRFAFEWPDYLGTQLLAACGHAHAVRIVALAMEGLSYHGPWSLAEATRLRAAVPEIFEVGAAGAQDAFPWVTRSVSPEFVKAAWEAAEAMRDRGYCLGTTCQACGACSADNERSMIVRHPRFAAIDEACVQRVAEVEAAKRRLHPVLRRVVLPAICSGKRRDWVNAYLLRQVLQHAEGAETNVLSAEELLYSAGEAETHLMIPAGETVVAYRGWDAGLLQKAVDATPGVCGAVTRVPNGFQQATWSIQLAGFDACRPVAQVLSTWLNAAHLAHTLRRDGEQGWTLDLAAAALKKKNVFACGVQPVEGGLVVTVRFSAKAEIRDLVAALTAATGIEPVANATSVLF